MNREAKTRILEAMEALETGQGNYVGVDEVRALASFQDEDIFQMCRSGLLVVGRYGGPRPISESRRDEFLEDQDGNLYFAIARSRLAA